MKLWNVPKYTQLTAFFFFSGQIFYYRQSPVSLNKKKEEFEYPLYLNFPTVTYFNILDLSNVIGQKCFLCQYSDCKVLYQRCCSPCTLHGGQILLEAILYRVSGFLHNILSYHITPALNLFCLRQRKSRQWALRHAAVKGAPVTKII